MASDNLFDRESISAGLERVHAESVQFWSSISTADFLTPIGDAWSPGDNVRHLTTSMRAVSRGVRMPPWLVRIAFGAASRPSRPYEEMRTVYRAALARGGTAGRFAPSSRPSSPDADAERARIMTFHEAAVDELRAALSRWAEPALDRCRLPHPLLGRLTVREMLLFTLYHNSHHVEHVRRRRSARETPGAAGR